MKRYHKKFGHVGQARRLGSATLELSFTLIILLTVSYMTIEMGYYFYVKNQFQGAAREGVRAAVVSGATQSDVTGAVSNVMSTAGLSSSGYTVTTSPSNIANADPGEAVTVTVQTTWGLVGGPFRGPAKISPLKDSKVLKGVAVMRKE